MITSNADAPPRSSALPKPSLLARISLGLASLYTRALAALLLLQLVAQARSGWLALVAVFAPYLFLPVVLLLPLLLLRGTVVLRFTVALCLLCGLPFAPRLHIGSVRDDTSGVVLTVMTWNVAFGHADADAVRRFVEERPADIVALEEDYASWWDPDFARWQAREASLARIYPYQLRRHTQGLSILSVYPILESSVVAATGAGHDAPPVAWGRFDLGGGRTLVVAVAHPRNPTGRGCDPRRLCYDPVARDNEIRQIREAVTPFLARGEPLVLAGDFNLTEREPAYRELTAGLWDAQRAVGGGLGHTWRPFAFTRVAVPLLRIDYVLGSSTTRPLRLLRDCTTQGTDHCALTATIAFR